MIRIVVADDHSGVRLSLSRFLAKQPQMAVVGTAESGARALELVEQCRPDILVLDVMMSDMTGIEVARKLQGKINAPRIIIFSNYYDRELIRSLLGLGVLGYIAKEDGATYLPEAIQQVYVGKSWLGPAVETKKN